MSALCFCRACSFSLGPAPALSPVFGSLAVTSVILSPVTVTVTVTAPYGEFTVLPVIFFGAPPAAAGGGLDFPVAAGAGAPEPDGVAGPDPAGSSWATGSGVSDPACALIPTSSVVAAAVPRMAIAARRMVDEPPGYSSNALTWIWRFGTFSGRSAVTMAFAKSGGPHR